MSRQEAPHVVMLPSPGMGHLIPIVELAKLLVSHHRFFVTFIIPSGSSPPPKAQEAFLQSLPEYFDYILLPPPLSDGSFDENGGPEAQICLTITHSLSLIRVALATLTKKATLAAVVIDPFGIDIIDLAKGFDVLLYMHFGSAAINLLFTFHLPRLDEEVEGEYRYMHNPVILPGCVPLHGKDFADPFQQRSSETYKRFLDQCKRFNLVDGILVNSFIELEPGAIRALQDDDPRRPPVHPIGPIIQSVSNCEVDGSGYLNWLNNQPSGSVLYVSFGSGGTLSCDQFHELALGLEMSEQRFLWVVRAPNDKSSCPSYCNAQGEVDPLEFLPDGFLERTEIRGLVVPSWVCQIKVLSRNSTGGFLMHCGWNSTLESIMHGVPLIAWPLYAEQRTNAVMLTEDLKVALRPKANGKGLLDRDEVSRVVKVLMEGEEGKRVRERAKELKDLANRALSEGGSSRKAMAQVAIKWRDQRCSRNQ